MYKEPRLGIQLEHAVRTNPDYPCPNEILARQVGIRVMHMNLHGHYLHGVIEVNEAVAKDVEDFFAYAFNLGFPISSVTPASAISYKFNDGLLMEHNVTSGFNYRPINGSGKLSCHALGMAIDVNPKQNPIEYYDDQQEMTHQLPKKGSYEPKEPGTFLPDHELVVFMRERGWVWGGDWTKESGRIDRHHFQKVS